MKENFDDCSRPAKCSLNPRKELWSSSDNGLVACASKRCIDKTTPPDTVTEIVPVYSNYGIRCCVDLAIPGFVAAKDHCPDLWVSSKDKKMVNMYEA